MRYDTIIVGAGSAGAILAARLTEDPDHQVLLVEAGPDYPDIDSLPDDVKWGRGPSVPRQQMLTSRNRQHFVARATDRGMPMIVPRGRVTGGSSAVNAQIFLRGVPEDYDDWATRGNDRWSFQRLMSYFRRIEEDEDFRDDFHGTDGPVVVRRDRRETWLPDQRAWYEACRAMGFADSPDHNDPDSTGVGPFPFNTVDGVRWSTAIAYLNPARDRPNLTIKPDSLAHRVLFDGQRAVGIQAHSQSEPFTAMGDEVILSGGAIGSPHLLLLSGVGPTAHLAAMGVPQVHRLPGVGENLRDHPQLSLVFKTRPSFELGGAAYPLQLALRYTAAGSSLRNDMLIHPVSNVTRGFYYTERSREPVGMGMTPCIYLAEAAGRLRLRSPDPRVQPFLDYNYLSTEFDRTRMRESVRICLELAEQDGMKEIIESCLDPAESDLESDDTLDDWMLRNVRTSHHISGTCKMGPESDPMAVVDQFGRVHGLAGLRVADASIMPDCIRANTNVTTMVIGERIADFVIHGE